MTLTELRCPCCRAPVDLVRSGAAKCRYCGATLVQSALDAAAIAAAPVAQDATNSGFLDVMLDDCGASKIDVIKVVREHLHLGLAAAKELVEKAPCALAKSMEGGAAKSFLASLAKAGAKVRGGDVLTGNIADGPATLPVVGGCALGLA